MSQADKLRLLLLYAVGLQLTLCLKGAWFQPLNLK
jgi:hypothetical protein